VVTIESFTEIIISTYKKKCIFVDCYKELEAKVEKSRKVLVTKSEAREETIT
jgi:hypothetical protein